MQKYIMIKKDPKTGEVYQVYFQDEQELASHIQAESIHTDHSILSVTNLKPE